jgi:hypothetical protein
MSDFNSEFSGSLSVVASTKVSRTRRVKNSAVSDNFSIPYSISHEEEEDRTIDFSKLVEEEDDVEKEDRVERGNVEKPANYTSCSGICRPGPRGIQGEEGPIGPRGKQGPLGPRGHDGQQGPPGSTGSIGSEGKPGMKGAKGPSGDQGERGGIGPQGLRGLPGSRGPRGYKGPEGQEGPPGPLGSAGDQGPPGAAGKEGPIGPEGKQGPVGIQGEEGEHGPNGIEGKQGQRGFQGEQGPHGEQGPQGKEGPRGLQGERGERGLRGERGPQGPPCQCSTDPIHTGKARLCRRINKGGEYFIQVSEEITLVMSPNPVTIYLPLLENDHQKEDDIGYSVQHLIRSFPGTARHRIVAMQGNFINDMSRAHEFGAGVTLDLFSFGDRWYVAEK